MNPIVNSHIPYFSEKLPLFFLADGVLKASIPLEEIDPKKFWEEISHLKEDLYLTPEVTISKEMLELYALLNLEIPPLDLIALKEKISLAQLRELVKAKLPPLHLAVYLGQIPLMEKALKNGGDLNEVTSEEADPFDGYTPLLVALDVDRLEAFKWLLEKGAATDSLWRPHLDNVLRSSAPFIPPLLQHGFLEKTLSLPNSDSILHQAARNGDVMLLQLLIQSGASVDIETQTGQTALGEAIQNGHFEAVQILLGHGANLNLELFNVALSQFGPNYSFLDTCKKSTCDVPNLSDLIKNKAFDLNGVNHEGVPHFHAIIKQGELSHIQLMLEGGADKEIRDQNGVTPLHLAVCCANKDVVELLLKHQCDPQTQAPSEVTPLHIAFDRSLDGFIDILVKAGATVPVQSILEMSITPHQWALTQSRLEEKSPTDVADLEFLYKSYKVERISFLSHFSDKIEDVTKLLWKEITTKILCAHTCEIGGFTSTPLRTEPTKHTKEALEGFPGNKILMRKARKYLQRLSEAYPELFPAEKITKLAEACTFGEESVMTSDEECFNRIQTGKPTILTSGYYNHDTDWVFWDDFLVVCNRSGGTQRNLAAEVYRIDRSKLTCDIVSDIRNSSAEISCDYYTMVSSTLSTLRGWQGALEKAIEEACPLEGQKVANCTFASFEAALWALFALQEVKTNDGEKLLKEKLRESNRSFNLWRLFTQLTFLDNYITGHLNDQSPYYPDIHLCKKAIAYIEDEGLFHKTPLLAYYERVKHNLAQLQTRFPPLELPTEYAKASCEDEPLEGKIQTFELLRSEYYTPKRG